MLNSFERLKKHIRSVANKINRSEEIRHTIIGTVSSCNARCLGCPKTRPSNGVMTNALWEKILMDLKSNEKRMRLGCAVGMFGEPTLDPDFMDKIEILNKIFPMYDGKRNIYFSLNTNLSILNKSMAKAILEGFNGVSIHIESHDQNIYEDLMPGIKYTTLCDNLDLLQEQKNELKRSCEINVNTPINSFNIPTLKEYYDFWRKRNIRNVSFSDFSNRCNTVENYKKLSIENGIQFNGACGSDITSDLLIDWNGEVLLCCQDFEKKVVIGNINKQKIRQLMRSEKRKYFGKMLNANNHKMIDSCKVCRWCRAQKSEIYSSELEILDEVFLIFKGLGLEAQSDLISPIVEKYKSKQMDMNGIAHHLLNQPIEEVEVLNALNDREFIERIFINLFDESPSVTTIEFYHSLIFSGIAIRTTILRFMLTIEGMNGYTKSPVEGYKKEIRKYEAI